MHLAPILPPHPSTSPPFPSTLTLRPKTPFVTPPLCVTFAESLAPPLVPTASPHPQAASLPPSLRQPLLLSSPATPAIPASSPQAPSLFVSAIAPHHAQSQTLNALAVHYNLKTPLKTAIISPPAA